MSHESANPLGQTLIVQKYGGATLSDSQKIKAVAKKIKKSRDQGSNLIVVVSAMGKSTNQLIELANEISPHPPRREMDMLLSTGERISMALMSMALNDIGCPAISFTGSQAGLLTDEAHANAFIKDVKPPRVTESLHQGKVVVLAGFQGVSPMTKEVTTLGRGGSDTTAVAMAAYYNANRCEILKDVPAVFTADPNLVPSAKPIRKLSYQQLMEMTFWGAKVLHYRSVELAALRKVKLYIGPAHSDDSLGTIVQTEAPVFESIQILSLNTHHWVSEVSHKNSDSGFCLGQLQSFLDQHQIAGTQILTCESNSSGTKIYVTGPKETLTALQKAAGASQKDFTIRSESLCTVTATCTGSTSADLVNQMTTRLSAHQVHPERVWLGPMSMTILIPETKRDLAVQTLHKMISL